MSQVPSSGSDGSIVRSERFWTGVLAAGLGIGLVVLLNLIGPLQVKSLDGAGHEVVKFDVSRLLVDRVHYRDASGRLISERNWLSVQAIMWVACFVGLGELWTRRRGLNAERHLRKEGILPEDERTLLTSDDLKPIYRKARTVSPAAVLPTMIRRMVVEFRKSRSVARVNSVLDSSLELYQHRLDLRYTLLRYIVWLIPALGFLGTVIGIAGAMGFAGSGSVAPDELLQPTAQKLAVAFYTTWLALMQSTALVLGVNVLQSAEERVLNENGQYCLDNLVIRLLEPGHIEPSGKSSASAG